MQFRHDSRHCAVKGVAVIGGDLPCSEDEGNEFRSGALLVSIQIEQERRTRSKNFLPKCCTLVFGYRNLFLRSQNSEKESLIRMTTRLDQTEFAFSNCEQGRNPSSSKLGLSAAQRFCSRDFPTHKIGIALSLGPDRFRMQSAIRYNRGVIRLHWSFVKSKSHRQHWPLSITAAAN